MSVPFTGKLTPTFRGLLPVTRPTGSVSGKGASAIHTSSLPRSVSPRTFHAAAVVDPNPITSTIRSNPNFRPKGEVAQVYLRSKSFIDKIMQELGSVTDIKAKFAHDDRFFFLGRMKHGDILRSVEYGYRGTDQYVMNGSLVDLILLRSKMLMGGLVLTSLCTLKILSAFTSPKNPR
jgi:hypothetical protein